jgi:hypothetical protein
MGEDEEAGVILRVCLGLGDFLCEPMAYISCDGDCMGDGCAVGAVRACA